MSQLIKEILGKEKSIEELTKEEAIKIGKALVEKVDVYDADLSIVDSKGYDWRNYSKTVNPTGSAEKALYLDCFVRLNILGAIKWTVSTS